MEIIDLDKGNIGESEVAIALGNFDGVHLGHQQLIKSMIELAEEDNLVPSVLLFKDHTKLTINDDKPGMLTTNEQKYTHFKELGIKKIFTIGFSEEIMKLSEEDFIKKILIDSINSKLAVVGYDYRFGYKAKGTSDSLKKIGKRYGMETKIQDAIIIEGDIISSTEIRKLIRGNDLEKAGYLLGRNFSIIGEVVPGKKRGRELGFPTANLSVDSSYILPKGGVYYTKTKYENNIYKSITDIGINPTFGDRCLKIETHILEFDQAIYGEEIEVYFIKHMREDIKFNDIDELIIQVNKDIEEVKSY